MTSSYELRKTKQYIKLFPHAAIFFNQNYAILFYPISKFLVPIISQKYISHFFITYDECPLVFTIFDNLLAGRALQ